MARTFLSIDMMLVYMSIKGVVSIADPFGAVPTVDLDITIRRKVSCLILYWPYLAVETDISRI